MTEKASFELKDLKNMYDTMFLLTFYDIDGAPLGAISPLDSLSSEGYEMSQGYYLNKVDNKKGESIDILNGNYVFKIKNVELPKQYEEGIGAIVKGKIGRTPFLGHEIKRNLLTRLIDYVTNNNNQIKWGQKIKLYVTNKPENKDDCGLIISL